MTDYLNQEYLKFINDASASSFGWNFQTNAGIFLFLKYIKSASDIKIESKNQDIEINLSNGRMIFAQAKSAQDYTIAKDKKEKFKDALLSLSKNPQENNKLIYISNIPDAFKVAHNAFDNIIVSYDSCLSTIKKEIDETFKAIAKSISAKIVKEKNHVKKEKLITMKKSIENFDKSALYISTIYPYFGEDENRYIKISDAFLSFLINDTSLTGDDAISIKQRLLKHWQLKFEHNSTISDKSHIKSISKENFAWPIAALLIENDLSEVIDCLSFITDKSITDEVNRIMNLSTNIYHERFEFSNLVLQEYENFKMHHHGKILFMVLDSPKGKELDETKMKTKFLLLVFII